MSDEHEQKKKQRIAMQISDITPEQTKRWNQKGDWLTDQLRYVSDGDVQESLNVMVFMTLKTIWAISSSNLTVRESFEYYHTALKMQFESWIESDPRTGVLAAMSRPSQLN